MYWAIGNQTDQKAYDDDDDDDDDDLQADGGVLMMQIRDRNENISVGIFVFLSSPPSSSEKKSVSKSCQNSETNPLKAIFEVNFRIKRFSNADRKLTNLTILDAWAVKNHHHIMIRRSILIRTSMKYFWHHSCCQYLKKIVHILYLYKFVDWLD